MPLLFKTVSRQMSGCLPGLRRVRHNICQQQRGAKRWPTASRQAKAFQCSATFLFVCVSATPPVSSRQHSRFCQNWVQELHWIERALKEEEELLKVSSCISIRVVIWNFLSVSLSLCGGQINHISKGKIKRASVHFCRSFPPPLLSSFLSTCLPPLSPCSSSCRQSTPPRRRL